MELLAASGDLTGTRVVADHPVQVIGGHHCARVPAGVPYCDHLEEVLPPVAALGTEYVLVPPATGDLGAGKRRVVRVLGTQADTTLTYSTSIPGAPATLQAGAFADVDTAAAFRVRASAPVLVAAYMEGYDVGGGMGDPSLTVARPVSAFGRAYAIALPEFTLGNVDVIAPEGADVRVGNTGTLELQAIPGTGFGTARVGHGGTSFEAVGDRPFGLSVYGYQEAASWWVTPAPVR